MKRLLILFFFILFALSTKAQVWPKEYLQWGWGSSFQQSLVETYDKGYMFLLQLAQNNKYFVIVKTDINGDVLWYRFIGNNNTAFRIGQFTKTLDGGVVLCSGVNIYDPAGSSDPIVMKFDACGDLEWCLDINTPNIFDVGVSVSQTPQSDYILLTYGSSNDPKDRIQLFKFNSSGGLLWKHDYPGDSLIFDEEPRGLLALDDGYLITSLGFSPDSGQTGGGYERPYYIKTDTAGNETWRLIYGRQNGYHGNVNYCSTLKNQSGNFYNIGWHSNYCDTPAINECLANGTEGFYKDVLPGSCPGASSIMNWMNDSLFVVFSYGYISNNQVVKWRKLDTLGNEIYFRDFPSGWITSTYYNVVTSDKKIAALSDPNLHLYFYKLNQNFDYDSLYTHQYTYDSLCPHPIISDTINPDCNLIVGIDNINKGQLLSALKVYPNPANNALTIEFPKVLKLCNATGKQSSSKELFQWKSTMLEIYNFQGKQILSKEIPKSQKTLELDVSSWSRGLYYFRLEYDNQTVAGQKMMIGSQN